MANIVITTHWTDGDVIPFIRIGSALRKKGHTVTLITHCYYKELAKSEGLEFDAWDTPEQYQQMVEYMKEDLDPIKNPNALKRFKEKYESISWRLFEYQKVLKYCNRKDTVLVAKNRSSVAALLASEKFEIPLVYVFMAPSEIASMITYDHLLGNALADQLNELRRELELPPLKSWLLWQSSPKRQMALWPTWFAHADPEWPAQIIHVGFPLSPEDKSNELPKEIQDFSKGDEAPILITGGTSKMLRPEFYPVCAETCKYLGIRGVLVTRYEEFVPKYLPKEVRWFRQLPLDKIFSHVRAVIHHGGIGTLSGATAAGVPQLVLPYYVDRPYNAARLKELGIAECLPPARWSPDHIAKALNKITQKPFADHCRLFSKQLSGCNSIDEACDVIEQSIGNPDFSVNEKAVIASIL